MVSPPTAVIDWRTAACTKPAHWVPPHLRPPRVSPRAAATAAHVPREVFGLARTRDISGHTRARTLQGPKALLFYLLAPLFLSCSPGDLGTHTWPKWPSMARCARATGLICFSVTRSNCKRADWVMRCWSTVGWRGEGLLERIERATRGPRSGLSIH